MAKADLEEATAQYHTEMARCTQFVQDGRYADAITHALRAWEHADGMVKYGKKYSGTEFKSVSCADIILRYAPLLLDGESLYRMTVLLKRYKAVELHTSDDLGARLESSRKALAEAHRVWDHIERHGECRQDELRQHLGGDQDSWRSLVETWDRLGMVRRRVAGSSYTLTIATNLDEITTGKCVRCGTLEKSAKRAFCSRRVCAACGRAVLHVVVESSSLPQIGS